MDNSQQEHQMIREYIKCVCGPNCEVSYRTRKCCNDSELHDLYITANKEHTGVMHFYINN
jgi:hypothetical protein